MTTEPTVPSGTRAFAWERLEAQRVAEGWRIPERDAAGTITAWVLRTDDGRKITENGGRRGLIYPWPLPERAGTSADDPLLLTEGASDTAAAMSLGFDAVGRAMANGCLRLVAEVVKGRHVAIVEDADQAGERGAAELAELLAPVCASVRRVRPPHKDLREWVEVGLATKEDVLERVAAAAPMVGTATDPEFAGVEAVDLADLVEGYPSLRPRVVEGLLRRGEVMNLVAAPKVGKTWLAHSLGVAVASGTAWMGRPTTAGRVALIDGELHRETLAFRLRSALRTVGDVPVPMRVWPVRGKGLSILDLGRILEPEPEPFDLIVVDALYRFIPKGMAENANEALTMVYNALDALAEQTGAAVVVVHHSTKGNQSEKAVTDVGAGGGAQARAADSHVVLREHEDEDVLVVDAAVRSWPRLEPFCVRWCDLGWQPATDLDPTALKAKGPPKREDDADVAAFVAAHLGTSPRAKEDIVKAAVKAGVGERAARRLLKAAEERGLIYRWQRARQTDPLRYASVPEAPFDIPT